MKGGTPWLGTVAPTIRISDREADREHHRPQPLDPQLQALERPRRQQLDADHDHDHRHHRDRPQRRRPRVDDAAEEGPEDVEVGRPEQDPAEADGG